MIFRTCSFVTFWIIVTSLSGCGGSIPAGLAPEVIQQPVSVQVPLGSGGTFSVAASGSPTLRYQWAKDGIPIAGATQQNLAVQATGTADAGSYQVQISNEYGSVESTQVTLSIGPRYPRSGDLRFQLVGSVDIVNGYRGRLSSNLLGGNSFIQSDTFGTPLSVGNSCPSDTNLYGPDVSCFWTFTTFYQSSGVPPLNVGYISVVKEDAATALASVAHSNRVITGMDLEKPYSVNTFSYIEQQQGGSFDVALHSVPQGGLQGAVADECGSGRVVTAVSPDQNGDVSYLSYGWQQNSSIEYECKAMPASYSTVADVAQSLAMQGYIITAMGGNEYVGVEVVGTKVKGDFLPRPLKIVPGDQAQVSLSDGGYAIVGTLTSTTDGRIETFGEQ